MVSTAFLIAALVLFILATIGIPSPPRFQIMSAGLACWVAASLVGPLLR